MKFYSLETIGGLMNSEFAFCMFSDLVKTHKPTSPSWWKWGDSCPNCDRSIVTLIKPLRMKWYEGSERIGDFACEGPLLCQEKVVKFFHETNFYVRYTDVEFTPVPPPSPKSRKPNYPIVSSTPYTGPDFFGIFPKYGVHLNDEKSGIVRELSCPVCGNVCYDMFQKEYPSDWWKDLVIDEEEWNGLKLFGLFAFGSFLSTGYGVFLSEEGRDLLMKQGFTNLKCEEVGRIEKAGHGKMKSYREQADYDFWKPDEYVPSPPPKDKTKKRSKK